MLRFFKSLCDKTDNRTDEQKLEQALEKSKETFCEAISSSEFSSESNNFLRLGKILLDNLNELMKCDPLSVEVSEQILQHDLIVAGTLAIVLSINYHKYQDPLIPFAFKDIQKGAEIDLNTAFNYALQTEHLVAREELFKYVTHFGKKILIDEAFPLLEFNSPSGGHHPFHRSVDSLIIGRYPNVKRHACLMLYDKPGQLSYDYYGATGMTRQKRVQLREEKRVAMEKTASKCKL